MTRMDSGNVMHQWATDLFPLCRSLTGPGVRETLNYLAERLPQLALHEVPTGTKAYDWEVPQEWVIRDAYIEDLEGRKVIDFSMNSLHVVGYSEPIDRVVSRFELEDHLHSLPEQPDAIPYVTSYYARTWGFCVSERQRAALGPGPFRVRIDADLIDGSLTYADVVLPGDSSDEVLLSTYVCHPSMANNELSGPVVTLALARWLAALPKRRFTYRIVFIPETIGSIVYLAKHLQHLRRHVRAGWVVTCVGDDRTYSFVPSRLGGTLADRVSIKVLHDEVGSFHHYSFLDSGSDERQWCSPGADLPVCSLMRSKYGEYPEYHTSEDDLTLVTPTGLEGAARILRRCIELLEVNRVYKVVQPGEPQLGKRGLYPTTSVRGSADSARSTLSVLAYCDGGHDLIDLSDVVNLPVEQVRQIVEKLDRAGVIRDVDEEARFGNQG